MVTLLLLLACEEPEPRRHREPVDSGTEPAQARIARGPRPPVLEVGVEELVHDPLLPGGPVPLILGGQGGWHVWVSGGARGLGEIVAVEVEVSLDDGSQLGASHQPTYLRLSGYDPTFDSGWFAGERAFLELGALADICPLQDRVVTVCARVQDLALPDRTAEACEVGAIAFPPYESTVCGNR